MPSKNYLKGLIKKVFFNLHYTTEVGLFQRLLSWKTKSKYIKCLKCLDALNETAFVRNSTNAEKFEVFNRRSFNGDVFLLQYNFKRL